MAKKRAACLAVGSQRKVGALATAGGRLFTDLRTLADAINEGRAAFGEEAMAALVLLRDSARAPSGTCLYANPYPSRGRRRWQASAVEIGGYTPSGRHALTVNGHPMPTSRLYTWSGSVTEAWVAPGTDRLHRLEGPAVVRKGGEEWWRNGRRHRVGGPALTFGKRREWWESGRLHRDEGPAVVSSTVKEWRQRGALHRLDGPAVERPSRREWYAHGLTNRADGPVDIFVEDGAVFASWFEKGVCRTSVEVDPDLYAEAALPYVEAIVERGDVSELAYVSEWALELLAVPACRRAVLDSLSRLTGEPSDFAAPSDR